jgi:hypothetical protein
MGKLQLFLFSLIAISCHDLGTGLQSPDLGEVLFEIEHVNNAWGFVYRGVIVDENGEMFTYDPGRDSASVLYHDDEWYSKEELIMKYHHGREFVRPVSPDTLGRMRDLSLSVVSGTYTDTVRVGADMGALVYSVYTRRANPLMYKKIILRVEGDWTFSNNSESAIELVTILKDVY